MPEADSNRKRSRSPSDSAEQQTKAKRPNTGTAKPSSSSSHDNERSSRPTPTNTSAEDTSMTDAKPAVPPVADTTASTPDANDDKAQATTSAEPSSSTANPAAPSANIHLRCLIVTQDASIIIGKGGAHVNEIRDKSGAKVMVSESIPGNPERILNVSGPLDAVSKAFGLIVRRINDEPFDQPSVPGSRAVTIKFMIPNSRMGSVIGKAGCKIKEIQDASGARLNASEGMLPQSTERVLSVAGVADAIHIATYYIGNILIEANERNPNSSGHSSYRPTSRRPPSQASAYGGGSTYIPNYAQQPHPQQHPPHQHGYPAPMPPPPPAGPLQTQHIFIPNDLVGCIIGKGGSKINEIRAQSQSTIKIMEPGAVGTSVNGQPVPTGGEGERLVVITGHHTAISNAVTLLYQRLEQEKQKQLKSQSGI